ncbi:MAG TPA: alkaline phosphatase [Myxococcota bacterium]|nr:alkaline phosphatase [Myxococcota bacterium]
MSSARPLVAVPLAALLLFAACARHPESRDDAADPQAAVARARALVPPGTHAKNVILFIGDGMGISTVTAARIREGQLRGESGEENRLSFEDLPYVALSKTYSVNLQVSESAATMTAMTTGAKTKADVIGLDANAVPGDWTSVEHSRARTLFEEAHERGLATGVVTTTRVTHATPAACYAHAAHRDWEDDTQLPEAARAAGFPDIARQLVETDSIDVALGGGRGEFLPNTESDPARPDTKGVRADGRNLVAEWQARHPDGAYLWNRSQLVALETGHVDRLLGLFDPSHMAFEADRAQEAPDEPSLSEMTARAIDVLDRNPRGFVLMVEGGRIDQAHHLGNAYRALGETIEFSNAVRMALRLTDATDTLIVVTADHSHVLTISGYPARGNDILGLVVSVDERGERAKQPMLDATGRPFTTLSYANGPGYTGASPEQPEGSKHYPHVPTGYTGIHKGRPDLRRVDTTSPAYLQEATVPARADTHGGEDVPIYAGGAGAELFHGVQEQSYIYHAIVEALGWRSAYSRRP